MSDNFIQENSDIITLRAMANVFMPEALDPVGQEDDDVDNDGDSDKSDEYLKKRRKAVGSAIDKRKKKLTTEAAAAHTSDDDDKEITEKKVKNKVVINPEMKESKDYDPMEDDEFDHDEAEENRGVSGKNNPKGGKRLYKKREVKKVNEIYLSAPSPKKEDKKDAKKKETWYDRDERKRQERKEEVEQIDERSVRMSRMVDRYLGRDKRKAKERKDNVGRIRKGREEIASSIARLSNSPGGVPASVARQAEKVGVRKDHFKGAARAALKNSFEPEGEQLQERPYQVMGYDKEGGKEKKVGKPVKSRKYADARAAELEDTHRKTGGKYRSQYVEAAEDRAKDEHLMRGGMAARKDYDRPPSKKLSNKELGIKPGKTWVQKQMEKKKK